MTIKMPQQNIDLNRGTRKTYCAQRTKEKSETVCSEDRYTSAWSLHAKKQEK